MLSSLGDTGEARALTLWDMLANLVYGAADDTDHEQSDQDLSKSLSAPAGKLAWTLYNAFLASQPGQDAGIGPHLRPRFDRLVDAPGQPGLIARVFLSQHIATLDWGRPCMGNRKANPTVRMVPS
jgi:hypothetical protein